MKKRFVIDTNVFLYDPDCLFRMGEDNDILVPIGVVEELDKFKKERNELGYAARKTINAFDTILSEKRDSHPDSEFGVPIRTGGNFFVRLGSQKTMFSDHLDENYVDNKILQICLEELEDLPDDVELVLVTKDTALRIKAETCRVTAQNYENSLVEDISMYDEVRTWILTEEDMADLHSGIDVGSLGFQTNEYGVVKCNPGDEPTAVRCHADGNLRVIRPKECYGVGPKNLEQQFLIDALLDPSIQCVAVSGRAGTGKTLLSLAAGLQEVVQGAKAGRYDRLIIMRPTISVGKELGFLPGTAEEKLKPWMAPVQDCLEFLHNKKASETMLDDLQHQGFLEIQAISYIRGRSMPNKFIIIDEVQNLSRLEIKTIVTRVGEGTKIVLTGDPYQIDNPYIDQHSNGLTHLIDSLTGEDLFAHVTLIQGERSPLAKLAAENL
jgi:PhoH-like ATPase